MKRAPAAPRPASRLAATFAGLRARGERALVAYFTAGDPSLAMTRRLVGEAARRGADVIELGIPFSDPLADGPVIQRATQRAFAAGVTLPRVLELVREMRGEVSVPLVFLTYYNPILAFGLKAFCRTAVEAGIDGVIVADVPPEEADPLRAEAEPAGLDVVHLVAPTSRSRPSSPSSYAPCAVSRPSRSAWASGSVPRSRPPRSAAPPTASSWAPPSSASSSSTGPPRSSCRVSATSSAR
jgi:hypothetical protein